MWNVIMERVLPSGLEALCLVLAFLIPYGIHKINQKLHKDMDPPWKQDEKKQQ